jgi:hypothetical protein
MDFIAEAFARDPALNAETGAKIEGADRNLELQ